MPAHYYQTVEMSQMTDLTDLVDKFDTLNTNPEANQPYTLWGVSNEPEKEYEAVKALKAIYDTMDEAMKAALNFYQNQHDANKVQEIMQTYASYANTQVSLTNNFMRLMNQLGPSRVIPFDPTATPVAYIEFTDVEGAQRGIYVFMGSWYCAQYQNGAYGYLVGNLPAGTKITYGPTTFVI